MDGVSVDNSVSRTIYRVKNDRMAGFVPSWDAPQKATSDGFAEIMSSYQSPKMDDEVKIATSQDKKFGFLDVIDMVNPLQHIPLVNLAYRKITGDQIKPISMVVGGGIFGGPVGAASGLVTSVAQHEFDKDNTTEPATNSLAEQSMAEQPRFYEEEMVAYEDLPVALLAFAQTPLLSLNDMVVSEVDLKSEHKNDIKYMKLSEGRTAGSIAVYT